MERKLRKASSSCMEWYYAFCHKGKGEEKSVLELKEAAILLNTIADRLESAKPKWISVEDGLPSDHEVVLVAVMKHDGYRIYTARHSSFRDIWYIGDVRGVGRNQPTHWMPLPESPKEDT